MYNLVEVWKSDFKMMILMARVLLMGTSASPPQEPTFKGPIEHVVLLMLENRAFDHMLGL